MRPIATSILALLFLIACIDSRGTLSQLDVAKGLMEEHSDSAKSVLEAIDGSAIRTRHGKAHYALLYSQALDKITVRYRDKEGNMIKEEGPIGGANNTTEAILPVENKYASLGYECISVYC